MECILSLAGTTKTDFPAATREPDTLRQGISNYRSGVLELGKRVDRGELNDPWAANKAMEPFKADIRAADEALAALGARVEEGAKQAHEHTLAGAWQVQQSMAVATVLALALGGGLTWLTVRSITRPLRELQAVASTWSRGDLSARLESAGRDEIALVRQGLEAMRLALLKLMQQSGQAAGTTRTASTEIVGGNQDLSARTEQAASHLQQTAAVMEQLTVTVEQMAASSRDADALAATAAGNAQQGGLAMEKAVDVMNGIAADSRRIADIIASSTASRSRPTSWP